MSSMSMNTKENREKRIRGIHYIGVNHDEVQEVLDSATMLHLTVVVQKDESPTYAPLGLPNNDKHVIRLWRRGGWEKGHRAFELKFGDYAYIEITPDSVTYYNRDFLSNDGHFINKKAGINGILYFVKSIHDVPRPYWDIPRQVLRHYIVVPKFKQFIDELNVYMFVIAGRRKNYSTTAAVAPAADEGFENGAVVAGKIAQQWIALLDEMTNIHVLYTKRI